MANDPHKLRDKTDTELYTWIAGWRPSTEKYIAGMQEFRIRNETPTNWRACAALLISFLSFIVAIIALIKT